ncbi:MAG: hypothetical protein MMC33_006496 [Icmadophila ericetorum]|nr:hypothetical protein [Icmadophila ericetorum]
MMLPQSFKLPNGMTIPAIGLGTFEAVGDHSSTKDAVLYALSVGYRHFDTAFNYENESFVGAAIRESGIPREQISVTTKLSTCWHRPGDVQEALQRSLNTLGLDYAVPIAVDYYLMHWPHCYVVEGPDRERLTEDTLSGKKPVIDYKLSRDYVEVWRAIEALVDSGMTKAIGVSNFNILKLKRLLSHARIRPAFLQVELHPYLPQYELLDYCRSENLHVQAHQPLGGNPPSKSGPHPDIPGPMRDDKVKSLAAQKNTSPAQVLLSWAVSRGTSAVPKSSQPKHIDSNIKLIGLSKADITVLDHTRKQDDFIRYLDPQDYLGFDIFNEEADEPVADEPPWRKPK